MSYFILQTYTCILCFPGISTLIENLFHTFGDEMDASEVIAPAQGLTNSGTNNLGGTNNSGVNNKTGNWLADYIRGADFEVYYVSLSTKYKSSMGHIWPLMAEGIYLEFGAMLVGVCCKSAMSMILNPSHLETSVYPSLAGAPSPPPPLGSMLTYISTYLFLIFHYSPHSLSMSCKTTIENMKALFMC